MKNSSICDNSSFCEPLPKNAVVVMEDSRVTQEIIIKVMENEFNFQVKIAESKEEALHLAENREIQCYLLDVHMGNNRRQEGIDALEEIKSLNNKSFVSILTGYPTPEIQKMAFNLGADLYREKSTDLENDIREIGWQIKKRKRELLQDKLKIIDEFREDIVGEIEQLDNSIYTATVLKDLNIAAYEKKKLDDEWFEEHKNNYVAFLDGKLIDSDEDEQELLEKLKDEKYQDKPIFFTKVEENPRIVDLPSSLWFDDC